MDAFYSACRVTPLSTQGIYNHGQHLGRFETFQLQGSGAAGGHAQATPLAEGRFNFGLTGFGVETGG